MHACKLRPASEIKRLHLNPYTKLTFRPVNILLRPSCHISINSERNLYNRYTKKPPRQNDPVSDMIGAAENAEFISTGLQSRCKM